MGHVGKTLFSVTRNETFSRAGSEVSETISDFVDDAETKRRIANWLRRIAGARGLDEQRPQMLLRLANACKLPLSRIENLYSGESRRIEAWEYLRIEAAVKSAPPLWEHYSVPLPTTRR